MGLWLLGKGSSICSTRVQVFLSLILVQPCRAMHEELLGVRERVPLLRPACKSPTHPPSALSCCPSAGLLEGKQGFNWMLMVRFFIGWIATLVVAGLTAGAACGLAALYCNRRGRWLKHLETGGLGRQMDI